MSADRYADEVGPRERIAWDRMKSEFTEANARCLRLRDERDEARAQLATLRGVVERYLSASGEHWKQEAFDALRDALSDQEAGDA